MNAALAKETAQKLKDYHQRNLNAQKGQVLFTGSSLMEMFPIEKFIEERGIPRVVYNRGVGGYRAEDLLKALEICVFELEPSRIFINIGTNDLSDPAVSISQMISVYREILERIKRRLPGVELYLMAYYPINYDAAAEAMKPCLRVRTNEKISQANQEVKKLAELVHGRYIDVSDNLKDGQGNLKAEFTIEGLHITEDGYRAILDDIMKYVMEPTWK